MLPQELVKKSEGAWIPPQNKVLGPLRFQKATTFSDVVGCLWALTAYFLALFACFHPK